jgi:hypothetical protein
LEEGLFGSGGGGNVGDGSGVVVDVEDGGNVGNVK